VSLSLRRTAAVRLPASRTDHARSKTIRLAQQLTADEAGFVISSELILVMTIAVLAMVVGLTAVRDAITHELNDVSHAVGAASQSYNVVHLNKPGHSCIAGFGFNDNADECDCKAIRLVDVCGKDDPSNGRAE